MARKRAKRPHGDNSQAQDRADWKREDGVELLARLDYILENHTDARPFKGLLVDQLENSRHKTYTVPQIERKVIQFWNFHGRDDSIDPSDVYTNGTRALPNMRPELKEEVQKRLSSLKYQTLTERLQCRRQLRSASRTADSEVAPHISLGVEVANTPSPRKRPREILSTSAAIGESRPRKRMDGEGLPGQLCDGFIHSIGQKLPKREHKADTMNGDPIDHIVADSEEEVTEPDDSNPFADEPVRGYPGRPTLGVLSAAEPRQDSRTDDSEPSIAHRPRGDHEGAHVEALKRELQSSEQRYQSLQAQIGDMQKQHNETTRSLHEHLSKAQDRCKDLQREVDCLKYANPLLSQAENRSIIKTLNAQQKEIREVRESLNDKERLRAFSTLSSKDLIPLDLRGVQAEMATIGNMIKQIVSEYDEEEVHITVSFVGRGELKALFCRSFGLPLSMPVESADQILDLSAFSFQAVIRSLMASAICEWVFESDLQEFSEQPCALLEEYRIQLAKQDGEIALRNLDFAAHTSLIDKDFFQQHILPAKAKMLADRLSCTLASVIAMKDGLDDSLADVLRAWFTTNTQLAEVFERALKIKAKTTVSKDLFEIVHYEPGSLFDEHFMGPETMEGDQARVPFPTSSAVKLCLLPSLHVYEHDRKLIEGNNFVRRPSSRRAGATRVTQAVVVLESVQATAG